MGLALLDTSIVIAVLNRRDALHPAARRSLLAARDRHALAMSSLTYAEILVGPLRAGAGAVEIVERFAAQASVLDITPQIARLAAELRASRNIKLPDALIVATGLWHRADVILTADVRWKGIETVRVVGRADRRT
jgi:predicted nucleic acid-binding protein